MSKIAKKKISIAIDDWETGDWPYDIRECFKLQLTDDHTVEMEFDLDAFDKVARKIAKEALEALLDDASFMIFLNPKGLLFKPVAEDSIFPQQFVIPFNSLWANEFGDDGGKNIEAWRNWLNEREKELKEG